MPDSPVTSTPSKARQVTGYELERKRAMDIRLEYAKKMRGHWRGPVDPFEFIDTRFPDVLQTEHENISKANFSRLLDAGKESAMYNPFIEGLEGVKFPANVEFVVSADKATSARELRPDIGMRIFLPNTTQQIRPRESHEGPYDDINTALCIKLKHKGSDDPFEDWTPKNPAALFETASEVARSARGQLAMYADRQFKHQPRRFLYQVVVVARYARLIYWDRSGAVVTKSFDIIEKPDVLAKFLWRFAHATEEERGWDATVSVATSVEREAFLAAVDQFATRGTPNVPSTMAKTMAEKTRNCTYPICKVFVNTAPGSDSDNQPTTSRRFLIGAPFNATCAIVGRGTRSYLAYDLELKELYFLKDTWWVTHTSTLSEMDAYKMLQDSETKHVLIPTCGGIVCGTDEDPQMTTCSEFIADGLAPHELNTRKYVHGRVVQRLACSLDGLKNSQQLIGVLRDVLKCIKHAYDLGLKHRDVTFTNIVSVVDEDDVVGILNDWDHAGHVDALDGDHAAFFSTTWQFMATDLLSGRNPDHRLIYDLQSVFWVLVYATLHFCKHGNLPFPNVYNVFDESVEIVTQDCKVVVTGGRMKRSSLLESELEDIPFESIPLKELVNKLSQDWERYEQMRTMCKFKEDIERFEGYRAKLENPDWWITKLDHALNQPGWPSNDIVPDQFVPRTAHEASRFAEAAVAARNSMSLERQKLVMEGNSSSLTRLRRKTSRLGLKASAGSNSKRKAGGGSEPSASSKSQKKKKTG